MTSLISLLSYFLLPAVNTEQRSLVPRPPQRAVPLAWTLYDTLGSDVPVFPSLRSASPPVSQLASQPLMLDCLRATLHTLHLHFLCSVGTLDVWPLCRNFPESLALAASTAGGFAGSSFLSFFPSFCLRDIHPVSTLASSHLHPSLIFTPSVEARDQRKGVSHPEPPTFTFLPPETILPLAVAQLLPVIE